MKQKMLITGGRRGLGQACATRFKQKYDVITTDVEGDVTIKGDLRDRKFLKHLVDSLDIHVLLNVAGIGIADVVDMYDINFVAPTYLSLMFYQKMTEGHIVNVSSGSPTNSGWVVIPNDRLTYNSSKDALK